MVVTVSSRARPQHAMRAEGGRNLHHRGRHGAAPSDQKHPCVNTGSTPFLFLFEFPRFSFKFFQSIFPILALTHGAVDIAEGALSMRSKHLAQHRASAPQLGTTQLPCKRHSVSEDQSMNSLMLEVLRNTIDRQLD
jgi:hypothetical protein